MLALGKCLLCLLAITFKYPLLATQITLHSTNTNYHIEGNSCPGGNFRLFYHQIREAKNYNRQKFCMFKLNLLVVVHYAHVFCERCRGEVWLTLMALLHYMTVLPWRNAELRDHAGPLSSSLQSTTTEQANVAIPCSQVLHQWKCPTHWYKRDSHERNTLSPY